jgi:hypothetical protein
VKRRFLNKVDASWAQTLSMLPRYVSSQLLPVVSLRPRLRSRFERRLIRADLRTGRDRHLERLAAERAAAGAFTATNSEADDPHHGEHNGRNPQQMNGESCAEKNEYQKSQQDYEHYRSPFSGARVGHRYSKPVD